MADATSFDAQANTASGRIDERTLHEFHFSRRIDLNGAISGHDRGFLFGFLNVAGAKIAPRSCTVVQRFSDRKAGTGIMVYEHEPPSAVQTHVYACISAKKVILFQ